MGHRNKGAAQGRSGRAYPAHAMRVRHGVNQGDALAGPEDVCVGDIYQLDRSAAGLRLCLAWVDGQAVAAEGSDIGRLGEPLGALGRYTLMADDGTRIELSMITADWPEPRLFLLPLSPIAAGVDYQLLQVEAADALSAAPNIDPICVSFGHGTRITMAGGTLRAIEHLRTGDLVLTRDHGPQAVRWIGRATLRAIGALAPVVISAGTLGNAGDLVLSQHHRLFLYQRDRLPGITTAEVLIQARDLIDEDAIFRREGGFVDYFSLVFDSHEIIYAEGVPVESLLVTDAVLERLPGEIATGVRARFPGLRQTQHPGTEPQRPLNPGLPARLGKGSGARA